MYQFDRYTGPSRVSASQICCRRRRRQGPNCKDVGSTVLSVDTLTSGVSCQEGGRSKSPLGGGDVELQINLYFRLFWGALARSEMQRIRMKSNMAASAVSRKMKPRKMRSAGSSQQKAVEAE